MSSHCSISLTSNTGKCIRPPPSHLFLQFVGLSWRSIPLPHKNETNNHFQSYSWEHRQTQRHADRSHSLVHKGNRAKTRRRNALISMEAAGPWVLHELLMQTELYGEPHRSFHFLFCTPFCHEQSTFLSTSGDSCVWVLNIIIQIFRTFVFECTGLLSKCEEKFLLIF